MKKKSIFTIIFVYLFVILFSGCTKQIEIDINSNVINLQNQLKILTLADIQCSYNYEFDETKIIIEKMIKDLKPDMIILVGDNFVFCDEEDLDYGIKMIDSFKLPWAMVMGNHDFECHIDIAKYVEKIKNSSYGMFKKGPLSSIGNYRCDVLYNNEIIHSLIFMDSTTDKEYVYDGVKIQGLERFSKEQLNWYNSQIVEIQKNNKEVNSSMFFHIPLEEYETASKLIEEGRLSGIGENNEQVCKQSENIGMFDLVKQLKSTKNIFVGHDHDNSLCVNYEGVNLNYCLKSSEESYNNSFIGSYLLTINKLGELDITRYIYK